jgi:hypothetical protein
MKKFLGLISVVCLVAGIVYINHKNSDVPIEQKVTES